MNAWRIFRAFILLLQSALEKVFHLFISQVNMIEQFKELVNLLIHIAINVIGINQCGEPAHTDQTVLVRRTVNPTKRCVGGAVHFQILYCFQGGIVRIAQNRVCGRAAAHICFGFAIDNDNIGVPRKELLCGDLNAGTIAKLKIGYIDSIDGVKDLCVEEPLGAVSSESSPLP